MYGLDKFLPRKLNSTPPSFVITHIIKTSQQNCIVFLSLIFIWYLMSVVGKYLSQFSSFTCMSKILHQRFYSQIIYYNNSIRKTAHLVLLNTKYDYLLVKIGSCHFENYDSKLASLTQSHILIFFVFLF